MAVFALLRGALRASPFVASIGLAGWSLTTNPFARPIVEAAPAQIEQALQRAMARQVTSDWLSAELDAALAAKDLDRIDTLVLIAEDQDLAPTPDQQERIEALRARETGWLAQAETCGICMADIARCSSVRLMAMCGVPFERTPLGDLNALRHEGMAALSGEEVDTLNLTLAAVGLGATAAVVVSGGSSVTVKAGASVLRIAHRTERLTAKFAGTLTEMARDAVKADKIMPYLGGRVPLDEVVDSARMAQLSAVSANLARVASNTSLADTVHLLNTVENAEDAARLAKVSDIAGTKTRAVFDTLGKQRAFRTLVRVSKLTVTASMMIYFALLQLALTLAGWAGIRFWRMFVRRI